MAKTCSKYPENKVDVCKMARGIGFDNEVKVTCSSGGRG
ncbi:hypothetical protein AAIR98_001149 [Elusimicrobium simillimum]